MQSHGSTPILVRWHPCHQHDDVGDAASLACQPPRRCRRGSKKLLVLARFTAIIQDVVMLCLSFDSACNLQPVCFMMSPACKVR